MEDNKWILCEQCIGAMMSRGVKLYIGDEIDTWKPWDEEDDEDDENAPKCEWCDEQDTTLYECIENDS